MKTIPPQNLEAEESVLGGILLDRNALDKVLEVMGPDDFYKESHRIIFNAMLTLSNKNEPIDVITLNDLLKNELHTIGGISYITDLADRAISAANIVYHAKIVREKAALRSLIQASRQIIQGCYEEVENVDQFLDETEKLIYDVSEKRIRPSFYKVGDNIMDTIKTVEMLYERKETVTGVPSGFTDLDRLTAGFQPSDLIILAARPGLGKSSLAFNFAEYVSIVKGMAVGIFSLEMSKEQIHMRLLCSQARVDNARVRTGYISEQKDLPRLVIAAAKLADAPIYIDDTPAQTILEIRAKARRLKREHDVQLLLIDYLQLMRGTGEKREYNRVEEVAEISRGLKALAKDLNIPIIALSQLNRQVEQRADKRPTIADLRESGSQEQDADLVLLIYRDEMYKQDSQEEGTAEIIVGKHRNGPTGVAKLAFRKEYTRFDNLATTDLTSPTGDYEQ